MYDFLEIKFENFSLKSTFEGFGQVFSFVFDNKKIIGQCKEIGRAHV